MDWKISAGVVFSLLDLDYDGLSMNALGWISIYLSIVNWICIFFWWNWMLLSDPDQLLSFSWSISIHIHTTIYQPIP